MVDMRGWAPGGGVRETCAAATAQLSFSSSNNKCPTPRVAGRLVVFSPRALGGGAQGRGGAHEGLHARGWNHPNSVAPAAPSDAEQR